MTAVGLMSSLILFSAARRKNAPTPNRGEDQTTNHGQVVSRWDDLAWWSTAERSSVQVNRTHRRTSINDWDCSSYYLVPPIRGSALCNNTPYNSNSQHVQPAFGEIKEMRIKQRADHILYDHDEA
jgi:hypothetical protein